MTRTFIMSDMHFGQESFYKHNKKYNHTLRPEFSCAEEADLEMVRRFNEVVPEFDSKVYFLGDISMMNGTTKILIMGNHDARLAKLLGVTYICDKKYILTHVPVHPCELRGLVNCHGHVHRHTIPDSRYINASVEANNYYPIEIN